MKKYTTETFIIAAKKVHGDKYEYDKVEYKSCKKKILIFCKIHKKYFYQEASSHLRGAGCPDCGYAAIRSITEEFIEKAKKLHKNKYNYDKTIYINTRTKVIIICPIHGEFYQMPRSHLLPRGCHLCSGVHPLPKKDFIKKAKKIHDNKYDYTFEDDVEFIKGKQKVKIYCKKHEEYFEQVAKEHLVGHGCPKCGNTQKLTTDTFIKKAKEIHGNRYGYDAVNYFNNNIKVKIFCAKHGYFNQKPAHHLRGGGCPKCNASKGEIAIETYLKNKNVPYVWQYAFNDLLSDSGNKLWFDFAIFLGNKLYLIEYDGEFHFRQMYDAHNFNRQTLHDKLKDEYCTENNIPLLRIKYTDYDNIETILEKYIKKNSV